MCNFFCLLFSNEVACAAPKTVIHFSEQGSYSVCIDLSYTVVVEMGLNLNKTKKIVFKKNGRGFV